MWYTVGYSVWCVDMDKLGDSVYIDKFPWRNGGFVSSGVEMGKGIMKNVVEGK